MDQKQLVTGNKAAWDTFVEQYSPVIYSVVLKIFHSRTKNFDESDVNDAVQEIFIRLIKENYRLLKMYNPSKASLSTWLTIIARNTTIDIFRQRQLNTVSLENNTQNITEPKDSSDFSIDIPLDLLSPRQKLVLKLLFDKGMETSEIAELLNISVQTVRSAKHKALTKLRKYYDI